MVFDKPGRYKSIFCSRLVSIKSINWHRRCRRLKVTSGPSVDIFQRAWRRTRIETFYRRKCLSLTFEDFSILIDFSSEEKKREPPKTKGKKINKKLFWKFSRVELKWREQTPIGRLSHLLWVRPGFGFEEMSQWNPEKKKVNGKWIRASPATIISRCDIAPSIRRLGISTSDYELSFIHNYSYHQR